MAKASAAKIVSLAASRQVKKQAILSFKEALALHVSKLLWSDGCATTKRLSEKCIGMRRIRIPIHKNISVIV